MITPDQKSQQIHAAAKGAATFFGSADIPVTLELTKPCRTCFPNGLPTLVPTYSFYQRAHLKVDENGKQIEVAARNDKL